MRRDLIGLGVGLIVLGIIIYFVGSYLSSPSYLLDNYSPLDFQNIYGTHDLGNSLETIGLLIAVIGIVIIPVGYAVSPTAPAQLPYSTQNIPQPIQQPLAQQIKYCHNCGTQLPMNSMFCSQCGYRF